jgi:hypothetical protein
MKLGAAAILAGLALAWLVAGATPEYVSVLGHPLMLGCGMKTLFGIPCPGCGMTRSVVMTLHGHLASALAVNPVGPVFLAGVLLLVASLFTGRMWRSTGYYALATAALLVVNWVVVLAR